MSNISEPLATRHSQILGVGDYRPSRVVPNSEIVDLIDSSDEWIRERTGIESRRFASADESVVDMSVAAAQKALAAAGITAAQLSAVIVATITYPFQTPSAATDVTLRLGNPNAAAFDISAACAGFCYSVGMASDMVRTHSAEYVLVIGVEKLSDFTDPTDRGTSFIFADGAGAIVIGPSDRPKIGPMIWGSDATAREAITMQPSWLELRNPNGTGNIGWPIGLKAIEAAGITVDQLDVFIPHQANIRIIDAMAKAMKLPDEIVIARDVRVSGNTSAASIPLAMSALYDSGKVKSGQLALLIGFGAGLVYAAQVVELP
jgi:3-oxoacyl-[acyl-carrier-protein] synthase III